jgi:tryptophanyl-tRNA synthetase
LTGQSQQAIEAEFAGKGYKEFKAALGDIVVATLEPIQQRYKALMDDPARLDALMAEGAAKVRPLAQATLRTVLEKVGLR